MSTFDYVSSKAVADRLIAKFGNNATLYSPALGDYDPITGDPISPTTPTSITGIGVKVNYKAGEINGATILMGDAKYLLSTGATPTIGMTLTLAGDAWRVVEANPLSPDSDAIVFWSLQIRR